MNTPRLPLAALLLAAVAGTAASGCVVVDREPPPNPYGDIAFTWSFDGEPSCDVARVDEVDLIVLQNGVVVDIIEREPCVGGGLILTDYLEGRYEVEIDGFNRNGEILYTGGFSVRVQGGEEVDVGIVVLENLVDPLPPEGGDLAFFWAFNYPAGEPIIDCDIAGVREVDILLEGPFGEEVQETFDCDEDGAIFTGLGTGRWTMHLDAFGTYHNADLHLYGRSLDVDIRANREEDLGDVDLDRDDDNFADIEASWAFNGSTCAAEGVSELRLEIQRAGLSQPEDVTNVICSDGVELRQTFVPGTYTIRLNGVGDDADWTSAITIDLGPDTVAAVPLQLAPVN